MVFNSRPFRFFFRFEKANNAYATHDRNNNKAYAIRSAQVTCRPAILDLV